MIATRAAIHVAGRLWRDAHNRVHLIKELDRVTGQGQSAISMDDTLRIITCSHVAESDFIAENAVLYDDHVEAAQELPKKVKLFFAYAADKWDAEFYAKVSDDIYVNIDTLGATLATHLENPRVYVGCMKSGEVFS
ncbi:putative beta-1 3-galactosyltransferase 11 [Tripterygium wilfordii]|uniref:Putative beta-1 3-galactosyltransferase 11 n=1 Tax=Tripterygium wilfordii TaxID=458696 RepID=A0A7J7DAV8_TRIWF|nr:putative beta-1 3-galactosyltransferase 11 [Tripterygium wilfordii]